MVSLIGSKSGGAYREPAPRPDLDLGAALERWQHAQWHVTCAVGLTLGLCGASFPLVIGAIVAGWPLELATLVVATASASSLALRYVLAAQTVAFDESLRIARALDLALDGPAGRGSHFPRLHLPWPPAPPPTPGPARKV